MELFKRSDANTSSAIALLGRYQKKVGVHRRMVRQALGNAVPPARKPAKRKRPKLGPYLPFIDGILDSDQKAPRKQRHTAHRIYTRVIEEMPQCDMSEGTIQRYVRQKKEEVRLVRRETFVPQAYEAPHEKQLKMLRERLMWKLRAPVPGRN